GRNQVARLMRKAGLADVVWGRNLRTTMAGKLSDHSHDLVNRDVRVDAPNRMSVADITYLRSQSGFCYSSLISDASCRKIVGWSTRITLRTDALPLEALEHALVSATDQALDGLVHHWGSGIAVRQHSLY